MEEHLLTRNVGQGSKEHVFAGDSIPNFKTSVSETNWKELKEGGFFSNGTHFDVQFLKVFLILLILSIKKCTKPISQ